MRSHGPYERKQEERRDEGKSGSKVGLSLSIAHDYMRFPSQTTKHTQQPSNTILQRAVDFVSAYGLGFSAEDAIALLRIEDLFVETFEVRLSQDMQNNHHSWQC